jgi:hypothetical protein
MKILALILFFSASPGFASEGVVYEVYRGSFTQTQMATFLDHISTNSQSIHSLLKFRLEYSDQYKVVISADAKVRDLKLVQDAEAVGKILYIGSFSTDKDGGYNRTDAYRALQNYLVNLFLIKCSTCTEI